MRTNSLDLAAYLYMHGWDPRIERTGEGTAAFTFPDRWGVRRLAARFRDGRATENITHFMYTRIHLKHELRKLPIPRRIVVREEGDQISPVSMRSISPGTPYWYVEDGKVLHALYGLKPPHLSLIHI